MVTPIYGTVAFSIVRHHFRSARGVGRRAEGCVASGRALAMRETAKPGICSAFAFPPRTAVVVIAELAQFRFGRRGRRADRPTLAV